MKCKHCNKAVLESRNKSGLCQPCSARAMMNKKWSKLGDTANGAIRSLDTRTRDWLIKQADINKVRLSAMVASIIKDAYYEEHHQ